MKVIKFIIAVYIFYSIFIESFFINDALKCLNKKEFLSRPARGNVISVLTLPNGFSCRLSDSTTFVFYFPSTEVTPQINIGDSIVKESKEYQIHVVSQNGESRTIKPYFDCSESFMVKIVLKNLSLEIPRNSGKIVFGIGLYWLITLIYQYHQERQNNST